MAQSKKQHYARAARLAFANNGQEAKFASPLVLGRSSPQRRILRDGPGIKQNLLGINQELIRDQKQLLLIPMGRRKEGGREGGRKEGRREGGRKEGRKEGREEGGKEGRREGGREEGRKEGGREEGRKEGRKEGRREGRKEGGREGGGREGRKQRKEI